MHVFLAFIKTLPPFFRGLEGTAFCSSSRRSLRNGSNAKKRGRVGWRWPDNGVTDNTDRLSEILLAIKERDRNNEGTVKEGKVQHCLGALGKLVMAKYP